MLAAIGVLLVLQGLFTHGPPRPTRRRGVGAVVLFGLIVYGVVEVEKTIIRRNDRPATPP